jgi:hypothetical protein
VSALIRPIEYARRAHPLKSIENAVLILQRDEQQKAHSAEHPLAIFLRSQAAMSSRRRSATQLSCSDACIQRAWLTCLEAVEIGGTASRNVESSGLDGGDTFMDRLRAALAKMGVNLKDRCGVFPGCTGVVAC